MADGVTIKIKADTGEFEKSVKKAEETAENAAKDVGDAAKKSGEETAKATQKASARVEDLGEEFEESGNRSAKAASKMKAGLADVKAGIDMAVAAISKIAKVAGSGINYNAQIEQLQTSFEVMTGSAEKAAEVVERLRVMGAETPFETADLASTTQLLMQYGFTADDALEKMAMLGDIAQGNKEAMTSIATGYAQMSSAGKVNLQDIKQMINGGFNPLQEISERTGESMASLYDRISKGTLSIDEITDSMRYSTNEGGKFFQSMEKQSQTLSGQLSTLKDNANQLMGNLTQGMSEEIRSELLPLANNMLSELETAFSDRGMNGLIDSATKMIPDLLDMLSGAGDRVISALTKWAPKAVTQIMKSVPTALRGTMNISPQITTAIFEMASVVLSDLVAMLPELVPTILAGIANVANSVLTGSIDILAGLFSGIEKMFHKGQQKIAGMWIDESQLAKYDFNVAVDMDTETATSEIASAYQTIRDALNTDLLTDEQKNEILNMIGEDYTAIKNKLLSFGLTEQEAQPIADAISTAGETLIEAYSGLNVGIDAKTLVRLTLQAAGSRLMLKSLLKSVGLDDAAIAEVTAVYDEMTGKIGEQTPNIMEEIYDKLTDGKPDDDQTVKSLKEKITTYIDGLLTELETAYAAKSAELDTTAADYQEKKAALDEWYTSTKSEITSMSADMTTLVDTLAGAPAAVVQQRMEEFAEMERTLNSLEERIDAMTSKAKGAGENAFSVVRSGANADEATIALAIKYKVEQFKLDEQSAEDAYNATIEQLNADLASGKISSEEYNKGVSDAQTTLNTAKTAAKAAFDKAFSEIMLGIAESEGNSEALQKAMQASNAKLQLADFYSNLIDPEKGVDQSQIAKLNETLASVLGDAFNSADLENALASEDPVIVKDALDKLASQIDAQSSDGIKTALGGKVEEAWGAALEAGVLAGTSFDTSTAETQLAALYGATATNAATSATSTVESAGETLATALTDAEQAEVKDGAKDAGESLATGTKVGILAKASVAVEAAKLMARSVVSAIRRVFDSHSPSKVAIGIGGDFGEGMSIGLQESMTRAVAVAKRMSGQIVTSAEISTAAKVNFSGLQQEIILANQQASTPINLDGVQIAEIQGYNNSTRIAWNNTKGARGVGSR